MKLKARGKIWEVDYIVATSLNKRARCRFFGDYELIPDGQKTPRDPHVRIDYNTRSIENLTSAGNIILARVMALESDNQRLKDRLNAIESCCTQGEP